MKSPFYSIYTHGFVRATVAIPSVRVADCHFNVKRTLHLARRASGNHAAITLFPELGISAYSNEDLFHQEALLDATRSALPNAPKVGSGGSLSPRSDWRAPSDSEASAWLQELKENVPD